MESDAVDAAGVDDFLESLSNQFGFRMVQSQTQPAATAIQTTSHGIALQSKTNARSGSNSSSKATATSTQLAAREAKSAARVTHLRRIQQNIEDLLALSNAEHCGLSSGISEVPMQQQYKAEADRLLSSLGKLIKPSTKSQPEKTKLKKSGPTLTKHRPGTSRVQLRVSKDLARILMEFAKAGRRPSVVVEQTMWRNPQFQDAAEILGITTPPLPAPQKKLRRIQPLRQM